MSTLISPYTYFADPLNDRPLTDAQIYIGRPNTDPRTPANQISVSLICECDGSPVTVTQPLRTGVGGVVIYQGRPAQITVDGPEYALSVF